MKKLLIMLIFTAVSTSIFATESNGHEIISILENNKLLTSNTISEINLLSGNLSLSENLQIYNTYKKETYSPLTLNMYFGFGVGSFYNGDIIGGTVGLAGQLLTLGTGLYLTVDFLISYTEMISKLNTIDDVDSNGYLESQNNMNDLLANYTAAITVTGIIWAGFKVFDIIRPFSYAKEYNAKLKQALNPRYELSANLSPTINADGETSLLLGASLQL